MSAPRRNDVPAAREAPKRPRREQSALVVSIPSQTSFLALVRDLTRKMAAVAGFDEPTGDRISLAVDEATTNAIEHAYRGAPAASSGWRCWTTGRWSTRGRCHRSTWTAT